MSTFQHYFYFDTQLFVRRFQVSVKVIFQYILHQNHVRQNLSQVSVTVFIAPPLKLFQSRQSSFRWSRLIYQRVLLGFITMIRQMYSTTLCKRTGVRMILVQYNTKRQMFLLYTLTIIQWATIIGQQQETYYFSFSVLF